MRSPKKRSLLSVNEHFEGEYNDKIHFLFSLTYLLSVYTPNHAPIVSLHAYRQQGSCAVAR